MKPQIRKLYLCGAAPSPDMGACVCYARIFAHALILYHILSAIATLHPIFTKYLQLNIHKFGDDQLVIPDVGLLIYALRTEMRE